MEVYTIDLTLILLLPHVVLTHVTTHTSESMDSSIINLLHTNTPVCDSKTSTQDLDHQLRCLVMVATSTTLGGAICTLLSLNKNVPWGFLIY